MGKTESGTGESALSAHGAASRRREARPGALRGTAVLTLQTRQAQQLVKGRGRSADKPAIIGLIGFANLVRSVWHGARADDPYADWWMLKVQTALNEAQREIASMDEAIGSRLQGMGALEVGLPASARPARISLNFSNPYAFQAARIIGAFDELACKILSARHVGLLARQQAEGLLYQAGRIVRRFLQSPVGYRFLGVTRREVMQGTAKALRAAELMGEVPTDVLVGIVRAQHAPAVVCAQVPQPVSDAAGLRALPDVS